MTNFTTDSEAIAQALAKGIISKEDFDLWTGAQNYKGALKKSLDHDEISGQVFTSETAKADSFYWQRDHTANTFKFKLHGRAFEPLNLFPKQIVKAIPQQPLQRAKPNTFNDGANRLKAAVDNIVTMAAEMKKKFQSKK